MEDFNQGNPNNGAANQYGKTVSSTPQGSGVNVGDEINRFFKDDLKNMVVNLFKYPYSGAQRFLDNSVKSVYSPLCMIILSFLVVIIFSLLSSIGSSVNFGTIVKMGLMPVFFALFITLFMFVFMAIKKNTDLLLAFRHSSIHVFLFTVAFVIIMLISMIFFDTSNILNFLSSNFKGASALMSLVIIFAFSMGISASRQLLHTCESAEKEAYSWYFALLVDCLSLWLTIRIFVAMLY